MNLLLDTHVALWFISSSARLPADVSDMIEREDNRVFVSIASLWEIEIKKSLHRDQIPFSIEEILGYFLESDFSILSIELKHIAAVEHLPFYHRDPFDRLIIAQAVSENLSLISHDGKFPQYGDFVIQI